MSPQVLVDSSAWVEVLRNRAAPALRQSVEAALHEGRAALTAPVWVELYRGVRGKRELQQLDSLRKLCQWLDFDDDCWELAAQTARQCREGGATCAGRRARVRLCATAWRGNHRARCTFRADSQSH